MDIGTIIIASVFVIACIVPFIIIQRKNKQRAIQLLNSLNEIASHYKSIITHSDTWLNAAIGIDETSNFIFFTKKVEDHWILQQVNIGDLQSCVVHDTGRTASNNNSSKVTDKLELAFNYKEKSKKDTVFILYDVKTDRLSISSEIQIANKWCHLVKERIGQLK